MSIRNYTTENNKYLEERCHVEQSGLFFALADYIVLHAIRKNREGKLIITHTKIYYGLNEIRINPVFFHKDLSILKELKKLSAKCRSTLLREVFISISNINMENREVILL